MDVKIFIERDVKGDDLEMVYCYRVDIRKFCIFDLRF